MYDTLVQFIVVLFLSVCLFEALLYLLSEIYIYIESILHSWSFHMKFMKCAMGEVHKFQMK